MENQTKSRCIPVMTVLCLAAVITFVIYGYQSDLFTNQAQLELFIGKAGIRGPLAFILIQIVQVIIPVIPGGISCAAGVLLFGPWYGLLYNYIGIVIGSFLNFYFARRYGQRFIRSLVKAETYATYAKWLEKGKKFDVFFALAIFFPIAPDDLLCMLAGLTKMSFKKFTAIILLGKPASIAIYSFALVYTGGFINTLLH